MGILYMMMSTLASVLVIVVLAVGYFGLDALQHRLRLSTDLSGFFWFLKKAIKVLIGMILLFLGIRMGQFLFI